MVGELFESTGFYFLSPMVPGNAALQRFSVSNALLRFHRVMKWACRFGKIALFLPSLLSWRLQSKVMAIIRK